MRAPKRPSSLSARIASDSEFEPEIEPESENGEIESEISEGETMPHEELSLDESEAYRTVEDILMPVNPNEDEPDFSDPLAAIQMLDEDTEEKKDTEHD